MKVTSNLLKAFSFGLIQDCANLMKMLIENGKNINDLFDYVENKKRATARKNDIIYNGIDKECEDCGEKMFFAPVNTGKRDKTDDGSTFVWTCPKCLKEVWTNKNIKELIKEKYTEETK